MSFYKFIFTFREDDTPFGQLAGCIFTDHNFPTKGTNLNNIYAYVN
ncbi:YozE family protein [Staphylococcus simulans]